jgi:hypothetical protein
MKALGCVLGVAVVVGGLGCGGGGLDSGGSCGQVQPCGGSVVGSWKLTSSCLLDGAALLGDEIDSCPAATVGVTNLKASGGETFNTDLTYQQTGTETFDATFTLPSSCFAVGKTCADLQASFQQEMQQGMIPITSASCATSGAACVCALPFMVDATESGTYATTGTTLSTTPSDGSDPEDDPYCVQGNQLHDILVDASVSMGSMGTMKIEGDIVFTKQ